jgi:hypothetical protein
MSISSSDWAKTEAAGPRVSANRQAQIVVPLKHPGTIGTSRYYRAGKPAPATKICYELLTMHQIKVKIKQFS